MANGRAAGAAEVTYRPGLDGLRALAVMAVLLYHADVEWLPAGFLGVDVFFAISGYLICSLLLGERERTGRVSLRQFWARRARRLLPALFLLLAGIVAAALIAAPDATSRLRGDVAAALTYSSNWWQIAAHESYFESMGRPPLLRHLWSLAVEEQFYVLFPLLIVACRRRALLGIGAVAAGAASALLMARWWSPDGDPSRVYFGTDTRSVALCAGVALATAWPPWRLRGSIARRAAAVIDAVGVAALVVLALLMTRVDEFGPSLYRGGFVMTAVASAIAIAVVVHPGSALGWALGARPLRWLGTRSYAVYLWHWPVFMLTRPGLDTGLDGWRLLVVRLAVTAALAEVSWRLVEQPFRTGTAMRRWRARPVVARVRLAAASLAAVTVLGAGLAAAEPPEPPELLADVVSTARDAPTDVGVAAPASAPSPPPVQASPTSAASAAGAPAASTTPQPADSPSPIAPPSIPVATGVPPPAPAPPPDTAPPPPSTAPPPTAAPAPGTPPPAQGGHVIAVGDSVMLAARDALIRGLGSDVHVDAEVGRQVDDSLDALQRHRDMGGFVTARAVVVHLGTNGPLLPAHFDRLASLVQGVRRVIILNVRVPRRWESTSNATINDGIARHPWIRVAGWHAASQEPGVLSRDGVHPTPHGAEVYTRIVNEQLA